MPMLAHEPKMYPAHSLGRARSFFKDQRARTARLSAGVQRPGVGVERVHVLPPAHFELRDAQRLRVPARTVPEHRVCHHDLPARCVGPPHHRRLQHVRVAQQRLLDLGARDVVTGRDDHVVRAGDVPEVAVALPDIRVPGDVPAEAHVFALPWIGEIPAPDGPAYGEQARLYAGGTELLLAMKHDLLRYEHLVDLKCVSGLDKIESGNGSLLIGSAATHRTIERNPLVKERLAVFAAMETQVANVRVRATGTIGGNLCFAEPHSDPATLLLALEAKAHVQGKSGQRTLGIDELVSGPYENSLASDEVLTNVEIPVLGKSQRAAYVKFQTHERPTLGLALVLELAGGGENIKSARAVVGSVSAVPTKSDKANGCLRGSRAQVEKQLGDAAEALAEAADPVDDLEGSADYKRHLIGVFLRRAFVKALT